MLAIRSVNGFVCTSGAAWGSPGRLDGCIGLERQCYALLNTDEHWLRWFWNSLKIEDGDLIAVEGWSGW
jgi:hypothetical protein